MYTTLSSGENSSTYKIWGWVGLKSQSGKSREKCYVRTGIQTLNYSACSLVSIPNCAIPAFVFSLNSKQESYINFWHQSYWSFVILYCYSQLPFLTVQVQGPISGHFLLAQSIFLRFILILNSSVIFSTCFLPTCCMLSPSQPHQANCL